SILHLRELVSGENTKLVVTEPQLLLERSILGRSPVALGGRLAGEVLLAGELVEPVVRELGVDLLDLFVEAGGGGDGGLPADRVAGEPLGLPEEIERHVPPWPVLLPPEEDAPAFSALDLDRLVGRADVAAHPRLPGILEPLVLFVGESFLGCAHVSDCGLFPKRQQVPTVENVPNS